MATEDRSTTDDLTWIERLAGAPGSFDFHVALRRFEVLFRAQPRLGEAARPADEALRLGQEPSTAFEPSAITGFAPKTARSPARMLVGFLGLWGPNGPLPVHLTEYARDRSRHAGDNTLTSFVDVFHHRALLLFHRAWAKARPTVSIDREAEDAFALYLGAFFGLGLRAARGRDHFPDRAKLFYAGRFAACARNAEGLGEIIADYFGLPALVEEFVGDWVDLPPESRWALGLTPETGTLARTAVVGARAWAIGHKFRIVLGPLSRDDFDRMLPGSEALAELIAIVRLYTNDEWDWDLRLSLAAEAIERTRLKLGARLGWTTRIGTTPRVGEDLIVDPRAFRTRRVQG